MIATAVKSRRPQGARVMDRVYGRGLWMTHAVGFSIFFALLFDRVLRQEIVFYKITDLPILVTLLWFALDTSGRTKKVRVSTWDYVHLTILITVIAGALYADWFMLRFIGFGGVLGLGYSLMRGYMYFLAVREASTRNGFNYRVIVGWMLAAFALSAALGVLQAANKLHAREFSHRFFQQYLDDEQANGGAVNPAMARGASSHYNTFSIVMSLCVFVLIGMHHVRRLQWFEWCLGGLFVVALALSQSRGGLASFAVSVSMLSVFFAWRRRWIPAIATVAASVSLVAFGVTLAFALNVERITRILTPEKVTSQERMGSFMQRMQATQRALELGLRSPLVGLGEVGTGLNSQTAYARNAFTFVGKLDTAYGLMWVDHGILGFGAWLAALAYMLSFLSNRYALNAFSITSFLMGIAIAINGIVEAVPATQTIIPMGVIMGVVMAGIPVRKDLQADIAARRRPLDRLNRRLTAEGNA